jgi:hypothetical protein
MMMGCVKLARARASAWGFMIHGLCMVMSRSPFHVGLFRIVITAGHAWLECCWCARVPHSHLLTYILGQTSAD